MTEYEHEVKILLTNCEYEKLMNLLKKIPYRRVLQTNYYYDTNDQILRHQDITVRIRRKNNNFEGTIKKHIPDENCNIETKFYVDSAPELITYNNEILRMMGKLYTERTEYMLSDSICVVLDRNEYLDCVDYELEIECSKEQIELVKGIVFILKEILNIKSNIESVSKSERFFRRFDSIDKSIL